MKVKQLVILLFPGTDLDAEVLDGGKALFAKHVRKNLLKQNEPEGNTDTLLERLRSARENASNDQAEQAWLIQVHHKTKDFSGEVSAGTHYSVLRATTAFPTELAGESVGVYVVAHCDHGIVNIFGHTAFTQGEFDQKVTDTASKLVSFFRKIGLRSIKKLCLVACNTVPEGRTQKDTLEELVMKLHENEMHPLIAGWDLPIVVNDDLKSPHYGRKMNQTTEQLVSAQERKQHKFVYKYEVVNESFEMKAEKAAKAGEKEMQYQRDLKKTPYAKQGEILGSPRPTFTQDDSGKGKVKITWTLPFVRRMKYSATNWSSGS